VRSARQLEHVERWYGRHDTGGQEAGRCLPAHASSCFIEVALCDTVSFQARLSLLIKDMVCMHLLAACSAAAARTEGCPRSSRVPDMSCGLSVAFFEPVS
jgi:hypothetical protein